MGSGPNKSTGIFINIYIYPKSLMQTESNLLKMLVDKRKAEMHSIKLKLQLLLFEPFFDDVVLDKEKLLLIVLVITLGILKKTFNRKIVQGHPMGFSCEGKISHYPSYQRTHLEPMARESSGN